jgi:hypothetical protein
MKKIILSLVLVFGIFFWFNWLTNAQQNCKFEEIKTNYDYMYDLKYSSDWKSFAFTTMKNWKRILVKDWIEINNYDNIW